MYEKRNKKERNRVNVANVPGVWRSIRHGNFISYIAAGYQASGNAWLTAIANTWASVLETGNSADSIASATHRDSLTASRYNYAMRHYIVRNNARERRLWIEYSMARNYRI